MSASDIGEFSVAETVGLTNSLNVKASPGRLYELTGYNNGPDQFVQFHNGTTAPTSGVTSSIRRNFFANASRNISVEIPLNGLPFSKGIQVVNSTAPDSYVPGGNNCQFYADYL